MRLYLLLGVKVFAICTLGSFVAFLLADLYALFFAGVEISWRSFDILVYKSLVLGGVLTAATITMLLVNEFRN